MLKTFLATDRHSTALAIQRAALGAVVFPHGAQKLLGWFGGYHDRDPADQDADPSGTVLDPGRPRVVPYRFLTGTGHDSLTHPRSVRPAWCKPAIPDAATRLVTSRLDEW